eukprot:scaffold10_cov257-Pinguiococcus_pyrenoidosus.AAC.7
MLLAPRALSFVRSPLMSRRRLAIAPLADSETRADESEDFRDRDDSVPFYLQPYFLEKDQIDQVRPFSG